MLLSVPESWTRNSGSCLLLLCLGLLLALVAWLQQRHPGLASLGIAGVKGLKIIWVHRCRQPNLIFPMLLRFAVGGANDERLKS